MAVAKITLAEKDLEAALLRCSTTTLWARATPQGITEVYALFKNSVTGGWEAIDLQNGASWAGDHREKKHAVQGLIPFIGEIQLRNDL